MSSVKYPYNLWIRGAKHLEFIFQQELRELELTPKKSLANFGLHYNLLPATKEDIFKMIFQSRIVSDMKLELTKPFEAKNEKSFLSAIDAINWVQYFKKGTVLPKIKAHCYHSTLHHEGNVQKMVDQYIRKRFPHLKEEDASASNSTTFDSSSPPIKNSPTIYCYLVENQAHILIDLWKESLHKHGSKEIVGWGSLREDLAASCVQASEFLHDYKNGKKVVVWDPFCGSGTFLLDILSRFHDLPVRLENAKENSWFGQFETIYDEEFGTLIEKLKQESKDKLQRPQDIIGSDKSPRQFVKTSQNLAKFKIHQDKARESVSKFLSKEQLILLDGNMNIDYELISPNSYIIRADFEAAAQYLPQNEKVHVISNLPYGVRSQKTITSDELKTIYRRLGVFFNKNKDRFASVTLLVSRESYKSQKKTEFEYFSRLECRTIFDFENQGLPVKLLSVKF